ncbi:hypothetical protein FIC_00743 [Flavobacteriaceae bacterium 3519-10]|nr:hypothetical protein FIC_00743 [Flavobacteriaceae bacterium 3519-10]
MILKIGQKPKHAPASYSICEYFGEAVVAQDIINANANRVNRYFIFIIWLMVSTIIPKKKDLRYFKSIFNFYWFLTM